MDQTVINDSSVNLDNVNMKGAVNGSMIKDVNDDDNYNDRATVIKVANYSINGDIISCDNYPQRSGQPDCSYYMRTGLCSFGQNCRFNHPPDRLSAADHVNSFNDNDQYWNFQEYPQRIGQPDCKFYLKTGKCKFGASCKFHHPIGILSDGNGSEPVADEGQYPTHTLNSASLPLRPDAQDCAFYMRTGTCKYGVTCKFNHPEMVIPAADHEFSGMEGNGNGNGVVVEDNMQAYIIPYYWPTMPQGTTSSQLITYDTNATAMSNAQFHPSVGPAAVWNMPNQMFPSAEFCGDYMYPATSSTATYKNHQIITLQPSISGASNYQSALIYPQRPGQMECQYYMRTGECKFGNACIFHHPVDKSSAYLGGIRGMALSNPGVPPCRFHAKNGYCKLGPSCKFDHPLQISSNGNLNNKFAGVDNDNMNDDFDVGNNENDNSNNDGIDNDGNDNDNDDNDKDNYDNNNAGMDDNHKNQNIQESFSGDDNNNADDIGNHNADGMDGNHKNQNTQESFSGDDNNNADDIRNHKNQNIQESFSADKVPHPDQDHSS